jgi:methionyl-tRNA formyltransferase
MRLIYFGTPRFASLCLEKVLSSKHHVAAVVTAPDKPGGRGMKMLEPDVKRLAVGHNLDILQPEDLKDPAFIEALACRQVDLFCVVAFRILPETVFGMPPAGCINLHASLLPKYRGAAPINWAVIRGEKQTGLTTFFIRRKVDTGDILLQERLEIGPDETFGELHDRMAGLGGELLIKTIDWIESGKIKPMPQDDSLASPAPKITPALGEIDWSKPAVDVHNLVRGLSPQPGAYSYRGERKIILLRTRHARAEVGETSPGTVMQAHPQMGIIIACGTGALEIIQLKPESGKAISGAEYVRGYRLSNGERFGRIGK